MAGAGGRSARNKKIVADSGEAYASKGNCRRAIKRFIRNVNDALFEEIVQD
jgi:uncharacterized protein YegP (UPF0339 family)